ncbi:MAG TPA: hypothetical protein VHK91_18235 [Flavisolibacter sp.]|nr:hypothetical protein [Flavisolibacter sp.]
MSHRITLDEGKKMIKTYKEMKKDTATIMAPDFPSKKLATCETFDRADIDMLLAQRDCVKLRIYYGADDDKKVHAILVGVNSKDEDIVGIQYDGKSDGDDGIILEKGSRCPDYCPPTSGLNP